MITTSLQDPVGKYNSQHYSNFKLLRNDIMDRNGVLIARNIKVGKQTLILQEHINTNKHIQQMVTCSKGSGQRRTQVLKKSYFCGKYRFPVSRQHKVATFGVEKAPAGGGWSNHIFEA